MSTTPIQQGRVLVQWNDEPPVDAHHLETHVVLGETYARADLNDGRRVIGHLVSIEPGPTMIVTLDRARAE